MSKHKIIGLAVMVIMTVLLSNGEVNAHEVTATFVPPTTPRVSDPCTIEPIGNKNFINYMPPGGRGSEGKLTEILSKQLESGLSEGILISR